MKRVPVPLLAFTLLSVLAGYGAAQAQTPDPPASPAGPTTAPAARRWLEFEDLYGDQKIEFGGAAKSIEWAPAGAYYLERQDDVLLRVEAVTGNGTPAFDHITLAAVLREQAGLDAEDAERVAKEPGTFTPERDAVWIMQGGRHFRYTFADTKLREFKLPEGERRIETLSPRGGYVSYVREGNLFATEIGGDQTRQLTSDGGATVLNGELDWIYQEEVYGRGNYEAHWWRADEQFIAFLQLDERPVRPYTIVDPTQEPPSVHSYPYPKPGEPNPQVRLGVVKPGGGSIVWVDLSRYAPADEILIVRVAWAPDGKLVFQVQNRIQTWLELNEADPQTGAVRPLLRDSTPAWIEPSDEPLWLADGSFLWRSERDGFKHLYHYRRDGTLVRKLTGGAWEVRELHGVDARTGWVYFSGTRDGTLHQHAYRVPLDGGEIQRLTPTGASHGVAFDADFRFFLDTSSRVLTPPQVELRQADGRLVRVVQERDTSKIGDFELGDMTFMQPRARDGRPLNALLVTPPGFDPSRRYPVWCMVYGGPQAQQVADRWRPNRVLFMQLAAQRGFVVWQIDPRSASGEGAVAGWQAYRRLGERELADVEDSLEWLVEHGPADPQRIALEGYSYGGFMTCYALTRSGWFKAGIAGGPVTDWRLYDSIYTERLMDLPRANESGYDDSSAMKAAEHLRGRLLLVHGAVDDNVHFQNTLQMSRALQKHGHIFEMMVYPRDMHSLHVGEQHFARTRLEFMTRWLQPTVFEGARRSD